MTSGRERLAPAFVRSDDSQNVSRKEIVMQRIDVPRTLLSRRATLTLVACTLLAQPAGVRADHDGT